jgi:hypothetical protein
MIDMKLIKRVCGLAGFFIWAFLSISVAKGTIIVDAYDYCFATGILAISSLLTAF